VINKLCCSYKGFIPKLEGHGCMSKKCKTGFNYTSMFTLSRPILLVGVRARNLMGNGKRFKKLVMKFLIFPTPIRLHTLNFCVKNTLNMRLKLHKNTLSFRTVMHKINLRELAKIINKAYIIFVAANRHWGKPQTSEKMSSNSLEER
jgi:hypothetical protein